MADSCGIYCITNTADGKKYIGSSLKVEHRWADHRWRLNSCSHRNTYLQRAWIKYGSENFIFEIIEHCPAHLLQQQEKYWIEKFASHIRKNGYNLTICCNGIVWLSNETIKKKSESAKRLWNREGFREKAVKSMEEARSNPNEIRILGQIKSGLIRRKTGKVAEYDKNNNLIKIYDDRRSAFLAYAGMKNNNAARNVYRVLSGENKSYHGKVFKYI